MNYPSINRYWGSEVESKNDKSDGFLNLLAKIEERKKQRGASKASIGKVSSVVDHTSFREQELFNNHPTEKKFKLDIPKPKLLIEELRVKKLKLDKDEELTGSSAERLRFPTSEENNVENASFTIIKGVESKKHRKVKRTLPVWLGRPSIVSVDLKNLSTTVSGIPELDKSLIAQLKRNKITHFFPVQSQLIPWLLKFHENCKHYWPRDVCVSAPTGSGKTLAFVLPIVQLLKYRLIRNVGALVVLPTKDLSSQVYKVFKQYLIGTDLKAIHLGNKTLEKEKLQVIARDEVRGYRSLVDIIVTTPGRLVEHLKYTDGLSFSNLKFLVIDEADHVMDSAQNDWLMHLQSRIPPFSKGAEVPYLTLWNIAKKPPRTQKLLFSATLSQDPEKLKQLNLFQPCLFTSVVECEYSDKNAFLQSRVGENSSEFIGKFSTPAELDEFYTVCPLSIKPLALYHIVRKNNWRRILCFADSIANVHKLNKLLRELTKFDEDQTSLNIVEISSKLAANVHRSILERFSKNEIDVLVTTDALARGIDLQNVDYVILYDAPKYLKNYIHRIGRTGRAGNKGTSLVLVTPEQETHFRSMLNTASKCNVKEIPVAVSDLKHLETVYKKALDALRSDTEVEKFGGARNTKTKRKNARKTFKRKKKDDRQ